MAKEISLLQMWGDGEAVNVILPMMEKVFAVSQRCSNWICLISAAGFFHSWISSAGRLCLVLSHFVLGFAVCAVARRHVQGADGEWVCSEHCTNCSNN